MAKLNDDQIKWVLSLDAKGVQGELDSLSSRSIQLTNENKKLTAELKQVDKWLRDAEKDMLKYSQAGDTTSKSYQRAKESFEQFSTSAENLRQQIVANNKAIKEFDDTADQIIRTMRVEDMTMDQLKKRARELEIQLYKTSAAADPQAFSQLDSELKEVQNRIGELKNGGEETASMFSGTLVKGIAGVTIAIAAAKQAFRLFEDVMMSNRATGIEFKGTMDGVNNALDYFKASIANMDFTNFIDGLKEAYKVGREVSLMLEDIYDRSNSFRLTSAKEIAEIEELKTDLRDVNLSEKERIEIGTQIIERTKKLAEEEKKLHGDRLEAAKKLLVSQTNMTDAEIEYMTVNRNANEQNIQNIKKIKDLEGDLIVLKGQAETWDKYSDNGPNRPRNKYYVNKLKETNDEIELYERVIKKQKETYGLSVPEQYEIASNAIDKYYKADKKMVDNYINARLDMEQVGIKTTRSLRMTQRTIDALTKKQTDKNLGGSTAEQRQRTALNEFNKKMEITYQEDIAKIKKEYLEGDIKTEADYKRKLFASDQANYLLRKESLEEFLKTPLDKKVRSEIEKEIATLETKRLDQEIKYQAELEKIILNANPVAKEKRAYEERLSAAGLFGAEKDKMTADQLEALELLEKQHYDNLDKIERDAKALKKAKSEKEFEEQFKTRKDELQLELNELMVQAQTLKGDSYEAEMAVHMKRLQMINEEIAARKSAGLEVTKQLENVGRIETQLTATIQKETAKRAATYNKYSTTLGTAMGDFLSGQKTALDAFGNAMLDILFDVLTQIVNQKIIEATAVAIAEQAKAAAIASAMPDSVATFGVSGAVRTAAIGAIIMGALQAAKATLKGLIGKKSSSSTSNTGSVGERVYSGGYAEGGHHGGYTGPGGKYDVKGHFSDGQPYHADEYIIPKFVLHKPGVPSIVRHLESIRRQNSNKNPLPEGFAEGGLHTDGQSSGENDTIQFLQMMYPLLNELIVVLNEVRDKEFEINYYKFERAQAIVEKARSGARKR